MGIDPDTKDWTWVLERPCDECGFVASAVPRGELSGRLLANAGAWVEVLAMQPGARDRPNPHTWSPLEYGCHVRDVHRLFGVRLDRMLDEDDPEFENWDQDETAVAQRYDEQDPAVVAGELVDAARATADRFAAVRDDQWQRRGRRDNGAQFSVESIGRYYLHDVEHHLHDVLHGPAASVDRRAHLA